MERKEGKQIEITLNFIFMSSCHRKGQRISAELEQGKRPASSIYRRGKAANIAKFKGREVEEIK